MLVENELDAYIGGFHLDALSSGLPLNVDVDTTLTVLAGRSLSRIPRWAAPASALRQLVRSRIGYGPASSLSAQASS